MTSLEKNHITFKKILNDTVKSTNDVAAMQTLIVVFGIRFENYLTRVVTNELNKMAASVVLPRCDVRS